MLREGPQTLNSDYWYTHVNVLGSYELKNELMEDISKFFSKNCHIRLHIEFKKVMFFCSDCMK